MKKSSTRIPVLGLMVAVLAGCLPTQALMQPPVTYYPEYAAPPCALSREKQQALITEWWARDGNEEYVKLSMTSYCYGRVRTQQRVDALYLQFRHQYPTMTDEEIMVLVRDTLAQERDARWERWQSTPPSMPPPPRGLSCWSNQIGGTTWTNCY